MAYSATVIPVMIASPGDVSDERNSIREIIHEWNVVHSEKTHCVLMPVGWETHSAPDLGGRPQELINQTVLEQCDLLVGVFWTRIGTPTGKAESGTVEEIRVHIESGKPAMVYFSSAPVDPKSLDPKQYEELNAFKDWCKAQGLIEEYSDLQTFSKKLRKHIQIRIRDSEYLQNLIANQTPKTQEFNLHGLNRNEQGFNLDAGATRRPNGLTDEAQKLIVELAKDQSGVLLVARYMSGQAIRTNGINFAESNDRRTIAKWEAAVEEESVRASVYE